SRGERATPKAFASKLSKRSKTVLVCTTRRRGRSRGLRCLQFEPAVQMKQWLEMRSLPTPLIVVAILALLFVLERLFPLRKRTRVLVGRLLVNFSISALTFLIAAVLVRPRAVTTLPWSNAITFAVIPLLRVPAP